MPGGPLGGSESFDSGYSEWDAGRAAIGSPYHTRHRKPLYQHIHPPVHYDDGILPPILGTHGPSSPYLCNSPICESPHFSPFMPRTRRPRPYSLPLAAPVIIDREKPKSHVIVVRRPPPRPTSSMYRFGGITLPYSILLIFLSLIHLMIGLIILVVTGFQWDEDENRSNGVAPCDEPLQTWLLVHGISCVLAVVPTLLAAASLFKLYGNHRRELRAVEPGSDPPDLACGLLSILFLVVTVLIYVFELVWFMIGNVWFYRSDRDRCAHVWTFMFVILLIGYGVLVIVPLVASVATTCWIVETATRKEVPRIPPAPTVVLRGGGPPRGLAHQAAGGWSDLDSTSSDDDSADDGLYTTRAELEQKAAAAAIVAGAGAGASKESSDGTTAGSKSKPKGKGKGRAGSPKRSGSPRKTRGRSASPGRSRPSSRTGSKARSSSAGRGGGGGGGSGRGGRSPARSSSRGREGRPSSRGGERTGRAGSKPSRSGSGRR